MDGGRRYFLGGQLSACRSKVGEAGKGAEHVEPFLSPLAIVLVAEPAKLLAKASNRFVDRIVSLVAVIKVEVRQIGASTAKLVKELCDDAIFQTVFAVAVGEYADLRDVMPNSDR